MARHVYDAGLRAIRPVQMRKAKLNGDPALFFLREPVRLNARECLYEQGLSVVDMPRRSDDHMFHRSASFIAFAICGNASSRSVRTCRRYCPWSMRPMMGGSMKRSAASSASTLMPSGDTATA